MARGQRNRTGPSMTAVRLPRCPTATRDTVCVRGGETVERGVFAPRTARQLLKKQKPGGMYADASLYAGPLLATQLVEFERLLTEKSTDKKAPVCERAFTDLRLVCCIKDVMEPRVLLRLVRNIEVHSLLRTWRRTWHFLASRAKCWPSAQPLLVVAAGPSHPLFVRGSPP